MSEIEDAQEFECPYCSAENSITIDKTGGERQTFITDCETCCKPIVIGIEIDADGYVDFSAKQEDE